MPYADPANKAAWAKRYHAEHKDAVNGYKRAWQTRNPEKRAAHVALGNAIRDGKLRKGPCEVGGDCEGKVQAHHDDYSKPLEVRWLCKRHHEAADQARRAAH